MLFFVRRTDGMLVGIFAIGVLMRLLLFFYNRPENSYDNHLETISYYAEHQQRPAPALLRGGRRRVPRGSTGKSIDLPRLESRSGHQYGTFRRYAR